MYIIKRRPILTAVLVMSVVSADWATKIIFPTHWTVLHPTPNIGISIILIAVLSIFLYLGYIMGNLGIPLVIYSAAGLANKIDALDGDVYNPFVIMQEDSWIGFNFADVCILLSPVAFFIYSCYTIVSLKVNNKNEI